MAWIWALPFQNSWNLLYNFPNRDPWIGFVGRALMAALQLGYLDVAQVATNNMDLLLI